MNTVLNNIDTSNTSLVISLVIFIVITFATKYLIDKQNDDDDGEGWLSILVSPVVGLVFAMLSMYSYKRLTNDENDILIGPFNSKINVV